MKAFLQNQHPLAILMAICLAISTLAVGLAFRGRDAIGCEGWRNPFHPSPPTLADTALLLRAERTDAAFLERATFIKALDAAEVTVMSRGSLVPAESWGERSSEGVKTIRDRAGRLFYVRERGEPGDFYLCQRLPRPALERALQDAAPAGSPAFALRPVVQAGDIDPLGSHIKWHLLFDIVWLALWLAGCWLIGRHRHFLLWLPLGAAWTTFLVFLLSFYPSVATPSDLFYRHLAAEPVLRLWEMGVVDLGIVVVLGSLFAHGLTVFFRKKKENAG